MIYGVNPHTIIADDTELGKPTRDDTGQPLAKPTPRHTPGGYVADDGESIREGLRRLERERLTRVNTRSDDE